MSPTTRWPRELEHRPGLGAIDPSSGQPRGWSADDGGRRRGWSQAERRDWYALHNRRRAALCAREIAYGERTVFRCDHERHGCGCGGRMVYWRIPEHGGHAELWDADGPHFAHYGCPKRARPLPPKRRPARHRKATQADLAHDRARILRRIDEGKGIRPVGVRGRRADIIRLIARERGKSLDRARDLVEEYVAAGYLERGTYRVLELSRFGISTATIRFRQAAEQRSSAPAQPLGTAEPQMGVHAALGLAEARPQSPEQGGNARERTPTSRAERSTQPDRRPDRHRSQALSKTQCDPTPKPALGWTWGFDFDINSWSWRPPPPPSYRTCDREGVGDRCRGGSTRVRGAGAAELSCAMGCRSCGAARTATERSSS